MNTPCFLPPKPEISLSLALPSPLPVATAEHGLRSEERGIRLIQLLITCAKHASSGNLHRADDRLRQISDVASVAGDSMQRLAARFASALAVRLVKRWNGLYKALNHNQFSPPPRDFDRGRTLFPALGIAQSIVTETLIRAMVDERAIHVVDLGSDPNLGLAILRAFSRAPHGPPHLRITCVNSNKLVLEKLAARLAKEAEDLSIPFQFNPLAVSLGELTGDKLNIKSGEALAFVSILSLHVLLAEDDRVDAHFGGHSKSVNGIKDSKRMCEFLSMVSLVSPKLVFLVEQEVDHNQSRLVDRFVQGLHYYSAVFDSIDTSFGVGTSTTEAEERLLLEEMFGREIENIVACDGLEREERHERHAQWIVRFVQAGFKPVRIWYDPTEEVKQIMEPTANGMNGFKIISQRTSLMVCWHDRPLFAVSLWTC